MFLWKKPAALTAACALGLFLCSPLAAQTPVQDLARAQGDLSAAGGDLQTAEKQFQAVEQAVNEGESGRTTWSQISGEPPVQPHQTPESHAAPAKKNIRPAQKVRPAPGPAPSPAPGYDGYMGTYTDPANGDIVTSVIAPTRPAQEYQNYPMYIEPDVSGWNGSGNSAWNSGWGNNGWAYPGQQVPGYPYPPAYPGFSPSGQVPGYPYPPAQPGSTPPPPPGPPPGHPGQPGYGWAPGNPGFGPGQPNFGPGNSGPGNPNVGPGTPPNRPGQPNFGPGNNPGSIVPPNFNNPNPLPPLGPGTPNRPGQPNFGPPHSAPGMPGRPGFGGGPGFGGPPGSHGQPGFGGHPGFGPRSQLTPPKNPGRPGSMPLVAPNFPPDTRHQPFVDLYRPPASAALGKSAPAAKNPANAPGADAPKTYFVPGSPQTWEAANWQTKAGGVWQ